MVLCVSESLITVLESASCFLFHFLERTPPHTLTLTLTLDLTLDLRV